MKFRSLLYIPGNSQKMLSKTLSMDKLPDCLVPDLEDSVPLRMKTEARQTVCNYLKNDWKAYKSDRKMKNLNFPLMFPRVNNTKELLLADLQEIVSENIDGLNLGKVETSDEMKYICELVQSFEIQHQLPIGSIHLIPSIETALGVVNAYSIASVASYALLGGLTSTRIVALSFGADDYARDMGFTRDTVNQAVEVEMNHARNCICVAARAANIPAIDTPNVNFKDESSLRIESEAVKRIGFKGKFAIHPNQVGILNEIFGVSKDDYDRALEIIKAFEMAQADAAGRGSTSVNGRMVDIPVYRRALNVTKEYQSEKNTTNSSSSSSDH